ncbi:MAG TPA: alpha/beta fold hydrolase, partial [Gammaproteobacteria bacterium]|nr:alpha/beta fold hydrolase [Gammaproteobacteria bacterium]
EPFDGVAYAVGSATITERRVSEPRATVICMHGYCENARYFTQAYADPGIQLILVSSADYHTGLAGAESQQAAWPHVPDAPAGSIEYDASVLNQALEHLPKTDHIRVHGHSRGGAVVLEAADQRPDLFQGVEVILEAPVLPQASLPQPVSTLFFWMFPLLVPFWRRMPISPWLIGRWGSLDDPRKRELIESLPFYAKQVTTLIVNLKSLVEWMRERKLELYRNLDSGMILIPEDDQVLDADSMLCSANNAGSKLRIVQLSGVSHFILLDRPEVLPPLWPEPQNPGVLPSLADREA